MIIRKGLHKHQPSLLARLAWYLCPRRLILVCIMALETMVIFSIRIDHLIIMWLGAKN